MENYLILNQKTMAGNHKAIIGDFRLLIAPNARKMRILNRMAVDKYRLLIIFIPEHGCPNSINKQRGRNKK